MKTYRMFESPCKVNENIDNKIASSVSRSPCKHDNIDNRQNLQPFRRQKSPFPQSTTAIPHRNWNRKQKWSRLYPKNFFLLPRWQAPSTCDETMSKHVRPDQRLRLEWREASVSASISAEIGALRILSLRPYITIETYSNCCRNAATIANAILKTAIGLSYRCVLFAVRRSNDGNCLSSRPFILLA